MDFFFEEFEFVVSNEFYGVFVCQDFIGGLV